VNALYHLGVVTNEGGDATGAEARMRECAEVSEAAGLRYMVAVAHRVIAGLRSLGGDVAEARVLYESARDVAREFGLRGTEVAALCGLAALPGATAEVKAAALEAFAESEKTLGVYDRCESRLLLWKATRDRTHLDEAWRITEAEAESLPEEDRETFRATILHQQIRAARREAYGDAAG